jgi:antitoxin component YwqK of YwqJK toxin-antitoxin module
MRNVSFILTCFFLGCHSNGVHPFKEIPPVQSIVIPAVVVQSTDSALHLVNGEWYYAQKFFSGFIETYFPSGQLRSKQSFYNGKEEGLLATYYENGNKDTRRYYHAGEKDSINLGWWPNGNPGFEYHFRNGVYEGDFKEWYANGKPLKHLVYHNGKEQSGTGWRENGKVYMSFVVKDGRLYGLINPNLCYSLKNERGEFVKSE